MDWRDELEEEYTACPLAQSPYIKCDQNCEICTLYDDFIRAIERGEI